MVVEIKWEEKDLGIILNEAFSFLKKKKFYLREIYNDKECVGIEFKHRWRSDIITFHLAPETDIVYERNGLSSLFLFNKKKPKCLSMKAELGLQTPIIHFRKFIRTSLEHLDQLT